MTRESFAMVMAVLTETFRVNLADGGIEGYWLVLQGLAEDELQAACVRALGESEFMPPPAKLLAYVKAIRRDRAVIDSAAAQLRMIDEWKGRLALAPMQAEENRAEVKTVVRELASGADVRNLARDPVAISLEEKDAAIRRMEAALAARRS